MFPVPLATSSNIITVTQFWNAVFVYHNKPHIVNRKLAGVLQVLSCEIDFNSNVKLTELFTRAAVFYEAGKLKELSMKSINIDFIKNIIECYDKNAKLIKCSLDDIENANQGIFISVRILLPRDQSCKKCVEVAILDKNNSHATFIAGTEYSDKKFIAPPFPYKFEYYLPGNLRIIVNSMDDADSSSAEWLAEKVFDKVLKWAGEYSEDKSVASLNLIDFEKYHDTYNALKLKYGEPLVKVWSEKAKTDPQKYIYEDIAITSYLICLWQKYSKKDDISFIDVGCGNGLLVHILNQEGYKGYGIDIRRRDTWDLYDHHTNLKVGTVTPESLYSDSNWIIGNHSDELTPWIPIIALKNGKNTNFFVLPCCPYDLNGKKFIRTNSSLSQYADYLHYIEELCNICGFEVKTDRLRIPSTKRTCLVGTCKDTTQEQVDEIRKNVENLVYKKCSKDGIAKIFSPRPVKEEVRNCTQLDRGFVTNLVKKIADILLETENIKVSVDKKWNKGGTLHLRDISERLSADELKKLKSECGGLQTLLKNHRYIFDVKFGTVSLREPVKLEDTNKYKEKPCWFQKNHPDGCLYDMYICGYNHE